MATKNPRLNITVESSLIDVINFIAQQEEKSVSRVAKELLMEAIDQREDMMLSKLAEQRDAEGFETVSHEEAWK